MNSRLAIYGFSASSLAFLLVACAVDPYADGEGATDPMPTDPRGGDEVVGGKDGGGKTPTTPKGDTAQCPYSGPPLVDVSTMAPCRVGGRCVPGSAVPKEQQSMLAPCDGGFCVAEDLVAYAGKKLMTSCKSVAGGEGRCISRVFPDVDAQKDRLPKDVCKETERCAPCFDPITGADSGLCKLISCDSPKEPPKTFAACCNQNGKPAGKCVPKSIMKPEEAKQLDKKECTDNNDVCAPSETFDPKFAPQKCRGSIPLLGGYDGVCLSTCIPRDFLAQIGTSQGNCDQNHFCAPCKAPITGEPTGAPGCGP